MNDIAAYLKGVLIGLDDFATSILFSGSQNDITISARCGMALVDAERGQIRLNEREQAVLMAGAAALDTLENDHCIGAIRGDYARAQEALAMLEPYVAYLDSKTP